jgi:hypothetical protein
MINSRISLLLILVIGTIAGPVLLNQRAQLASAQQNPQLQDNAIYVVYYWRARPGKTADYANYIRTIAEPIDEEARKAGVFEELTTYTPAIVTGAAGADWTHMRVFRLKNFAALDGFSRGLDDAGRRVFPSEQQRRDNTLRAVELRDLVRQEIWRKF